MEISETSESWTQERVRALLAHARRSDPRWSWKLVLRPETAALLDLKPGVVRHPDPGYAPLPVSTFDDCEVSIIGLVADFVLASPVTEYGFTPNVIPEAPTYWLNLMTGEVKTWTEHSLAELGPPAEQNGTPND